MIIHALVEGASEKAFLEPWAKRLLKGHDLRAYPHQGKGKLQPGPARRDQRGLLDQLPAKLAAFGKSRQRDGERVLVLVDADGDDVANLERELEVLKARLDPAPVVIFRFAVEELEAFYLADQKALAAAFPDFDRKLARSYTPDSICGTRELFGRVVRDGGGNKVAWAQAMASKVTIKAAESRSPSFKKLCNGLQELVASPTEAPPKPGKPRRAKRAVPCDATGKRRW
ncbi:MAG: DUF4276 family protein [Polyangiaceae bacterium]|nr:DUF4276 family protein [Polyangiaceae bacterium]